MTLGRPIEIEDIKDTPESFPEGPIQGRKISFSKKEISRLRSLLGALPKGLLKGAQQISSLSLFPQAGPVPSKLVSKAIEEALPTEEALPEKYLERTGRLLASTLGGGGSLPANLGRAALSAGLGQGIEEMGGGEFAQTLGELVGYSLPGLGRKIVPTKDQEKLVGFARKTGMTEKQIAPLLPSGTKQKFFGKPALKGEKTKETIQESRKGIGEAYEFIKGTPAAQETLNQQDIQKFLRDSTKIAYEMPFEIRKQLAHDAADLVKQGFSGKNLINYYQDISSKYKIGREHLERFKEPIREALGKLSPELAEDFQLTNEMFKRRLDIGRTLKPGLATTLVNLGELGNLAYSAINMNLKGLAISLGVHGARLFAREMLTNPRLQNITKQMVKAANENKFTIVMNLAKYLKKKYEEDQSK
jgi:hypothetical protein